jgi:hypothetical protein
MKTRISFVVVGAQKSGTTALHHHLSKHPDIYLPSVKETHFFDDGHGEYHKGIPHYLEKYFGTNTGLRLAGEVDPEYLFFPETAPRLAEHFPKAKLIFVFREPVSRAFSHYQMSFSRGLDRLDFAGALARESIRMGMKPGDANEAFERVPYVPPALDEAHRCELFNHVVRSDFSYVTRGRYADQVEHYLAYFPAESMLFLLSEDLKGDPSGTMRRVYDFLGVRYLEPTELAAEERNLGTVPQNVALQDFLLDASSAKSLFKRFLPQPARTALKTWLLGRNRQPAPVGSVRLEPVLANRLREEFLSHNRRLSDLIGRDLSAWQS